MKYVTNIRIQKSTSFYGNPVTDIMFTFKIAEYEKEVAFRAPAGMQDNELNIKLMDLVTDYYYSDFMPHHKREIIEHLQNEKGINISKIRKQYAILIDSLE